MGPTVVPPAELEAVRTALLEWYRANARSYPWRETTDPYEILVAEVMSQQTQLDRIVEPWVAFTDRWPSFDHLATADRSAVVGFWTDHRLGYNKRARYLHETARRLVEEADGDVPRRPDALEELPGVGPYTARAVASFAFGLAAAVVDTNVKRVLHRTFGVPDDAAAFETAAAELLPAADAREWNNAVMELGGTVCTKTPQCDEARCPWRAWCSAYRSGDFSAPDVPTPPAFEGSRRQFRGRIVRALRAHGELGLDELGRTVREDYGSNDTDDAGRPWLRRLLADLEADGLVAVDTDDGEPVARLGR